MTVIYMGTIHLNQLIYSNEKKSLIAYLFTVSRSENLQYIVHLFASIITILKLLEVSKCCYSHLQ